MRPQPKSSIQAIISGVNTIEARQDAIAMRDLEQRSDIRSLARCEYADHRPKTGGIHVRHAADVQNYGHCGLQSRSILKFEESPQGERPGELNNPSALGAGEHFNLEIFRAAWSHNKITLAMKYYRIITTIMC